MWRVAIGGVWQEAASEAVILDWVRQGYVNGSTLVQHASWPQPAYASQVPALSPAFGPPTAHFAHVTNQLPAPSQIRDHVMGLLVRCRNGFNPRNTNQEDRALADETIAALHTWEHSDPAGYAHYFTTVPVSDCASVTKWTIHQQSFSAHGNRVANELVRRLTPSSALRCAEVTRGLALEMRKFSALLAGDAFYSTLTGHLERWKTEDRDGFELWVSELPMEALVHGDGPKWHIWESEILWAQLPLRRADLRKALNRRIAERVRALYTASRVHEEDMARAQAYLAAEKASAPSGTSESAHRCGCCGAMVGPTDSQCDYCGVTQSRSDHGWSSKTTIESLCPFCVVGQDGFNLPSALATISNLKTFTLDGSFDDGLDLLTSLRTWYANWKKRLDKPTNAIVDMFGAAESSVARGIQTLVRSARGDSDKQRRLVFFALTWRRDFLQESLGRGVGGWFSGKDKQDAAWEKKVRDELGL